MADFSRPVQIDFMAETPKIKIMVVDDEPDILEFLQMLLEDEGYEVFSAMDGKEGFDRAKKEGPELITLDLTMPRHSGIKMYHDLKKEASTSKIPVIIITGVPGELADLTSSNEVPPPEAFLEKPINRIQFLEQVEMILADK